MSYWKLFTTAGLLLGLATVLFAQPPNLLWMQTYGGSEDDVGYWVSCTDDGGFILAGYTLSYGAGDVDCWIIKTDENGILIWDRTYGDTEFDACTSVEPLAEGGYILGATTYSFGAGGSDFWLIWTDEYGDSLWSCLYGGSENEYLKGAFPTSDGGYITGGGTWTYCNVQIDLYLVKTDSVGNQVWMNSWGGTQAEHGQYLIQTDDGGFAIVGETWSYAPYANVYLVKTDENGNEEWIANFSVSQCDYPYSLRQTDDGGYIVSGFTGAYWAIDDDVLLAKLSASGTLEWTRTYGGSGLDNAYDVEQTEDGGYIMVGYTESYGAGGRDVWVIKTDSDGNMEWNQTYGGPNDDTGWRIKEIEAGEYIVVGTTESYGAGGSDFWLLRLGGDALPPDVEITLTPHNPPILIPASGGDFMFDVEITNIGSTWCSVDAAIDVTTPSGITLSLLTRENISLMPGQSINRFDMIQSVPGTAPAGTFTYHGYLWDQNSWTIYAEDSFEFEKLEDTDWDNEILDWTLSGWDEEPKIAKQVIPTDHAMFSAYPNPFNPSTVLNYKLQAASKVRLSVYDVTGCQVAELVNGYRAAGAHEVVFDASSLPSGVYFTRMNAGDLVQTQKLLLVK